MDFFVSNLYTVEKIGIKLALSKKRRIIWQNIPMFRSPYNVLDNISLSLQISWIICDDDHVIYLKMTMLNLLWWPC